MREAGQEWPLRRVHLGLQMPTAVDCRSNSAFEGCALQTKQRRDGSRRAFDDIELSIIRNEGRRHSTNACASSSSAGCCQSTPRWVRA